MNRITKVLTLGILFLFAFSMQISAQKCKYDYEKKDPITGEATKGSVQTIQPGRFVPLWQIGIHKIGDAYFVSNLYRCLGVAQDILKKGDQIIFKLSNGEIVALIAQDECLPIAKTPGEILTEYLSKYNIDAAILQKIANNPPTYVRLNIERKVYEKEIPAKDGKKVAQAAACILQ